MVNSLVLLLALAGTRSPDRVGAPLVTFVVLALPCCTETEPDLEDFLPRCQAVGWVVVTLG